jgi:DNA (cytosine-5)-methyltransferase 1
LEASFTFYEFFAGAGMARAGLGPVWRCLFANDCDPLKESSYGDNWGAEHFDARDVALVRAADLAWASFPCQDVSQAGAKLGLGESGGGDATRSGAVWPFIDIVRDLAEEGRHPVLLALENVVGLLSSNGGADFRSICAALGDMGYRFGAIVADAAHFVAQSRPRVFIIALRRDVPLPAYLHVELPAEPWHTQTLIRARAGLSPEVSANWVWWNLGEAPATRDQELADIVDLSDDAKWNTDETTDRLIGMMSDMQLQRLAQARAQEGPVIGSLYLRMRPNGKAGNVQRAEIAFGETLSRVPDR